MKVGANFVGLACTEGMALGAARFEKRSTALSITYIGNELSTWYPGMYRLASLTSSVRHCYRERVARKGRKVRRMKVMTDGGGKLEMSRQPTHTLKSFGVAGALIP